MICERINLKKYFKQLKNPVFLTAYCPDNFEEFSIGRKRKTILILPGGGYNFISDREKEPIAMQCLKEDYNAFTLEYSIKKLDYPYPFVEVFAALCYIRDNAEKYNVDPNKIALMGFSAGGHLAACSASLSQKKYFEEFLNRKKESFKINALILGYPVITMEKDFTHTQTMETITHNDPLLLEALSVEKNVDHNFPKTFIWLTASDRDVLPYNSLSLAQALIENDVVVELHMYSRGPHGLALANNNTCSKYVETNYPEVQSWIEHCFNFLELYL